MTSSGSVTASALIGIHFVGTYATKGSLQEPVRELMLVAKLYVQAVANNLHHGERRVPVAGVSALPAWRFGIHKAPCGPWMIASSQGIAFKQETLNAPTLLMSTV